MFFFFFQAQSQSLGKRIKDQFLKLHHFLFEEEKAALLALKKEEEARLQTVKEKATVTAERIGSFSEAIRSLQQEVTANDLTVLQVSAWSLQTLFGCQTSMVLFHLFIIVKVSRHIEQFIS